MQKFAVEKAARKIKATLIKKINYEQRNFFSGKNINPSRQKIEDTQLIFRTQMFGARNGEVSNKSLLSGWKFWLS